MQILMSVLQDRATALRIVTAQTPLVAMNAHVSVDTTMEAWDMSVQVRSLISVSARHIHHNTDIDECLDAPCHPNATCNNSAGSYTCECGGGFSGNGDNCTGMFQCLH